MLEKINPLKYEPCYPNRLKGFFQSKLNYKTYRDFAPYAKNTVVGNIPPEIIRTFEESQRGEKIKSFQSVLSEAAIASREDKSLGEVRKVLADGLKEIMPDGTRIDLEHIDHGGYKNVYRFGLKDKNGNKLMHDKALLIYDMRNEVYPLKSHGIYAEPNSWIYLQSNMGHSVEHTQFTKHYISDLKSGYTLTEFIDEDIAETTNEFDHNRLLGVILTDSHNNHRKKKKVYDIGGLQKDKYFTIDDRTTLKFFKKIANRGTAKEREQVVQQLTEKAKNPRTPLRDKIIGALDFYNSLPSWYWEKTSDHIPMRMLG